MTVHPGLAIVRGRRRFYTGIALAIAITVFAGFAPTYYLRPYYQSTPLGGARHLHGVVFTAWVLLFLIQTTLVPAGRVALHRRLGVGGAVLAGLLVVVGTTMAIVTARDGRGPLGIPPLSFLAVPFFDMVVFTGLAGTGLWHRRRADIHKRLMTLATIALLGAPIARLPFGAPLVGLPGVFALADLFIVACIVYDLATLRRVHPATLWGGLAIVISQPLRLAISGTALWLGFARWVT
jgi:FtsH-binding integral membrane protein